METFDQVDVIARPYIDLNASKVNVVGEVAEYADAKVRAMIIKPSDASAGWTPLRLADDLDAEFAPDDDCGEDRGAFGDRPATGEAMASVILSPFPNATMTAQRPAAIACIKTSIGGASNLSDDRAAALGEAASALVERFAPDAPQAIRNEATIRVAARILHREPKPIQGVTLPSGFRFDFRERFFAPNAMVNSGARALLLPWRVRRALPIEDTT